MRNTALVELLKSDKWSSRLTGIIGSETAEKLKAIPADRLLQLIDNTIKTPVDFASEMSGELYYLYYVFACIDAFEKLKLPNGLAVLEIASGDGATVPHAVDIYSAGKGLYTTANLNKELTEGLKRNTSNLKIKVKVIEDNADKLEKYLPPESFDVIYFQHAVNDIIQTIVADKEGIDTVNNSWWDILSPMIHAVEKHHKAGSLKEMTYKEFVSLVGVCCRLLKKGGYMIFNNCIFQVDLDSGYSMELYSSYIKMAEEWIGAAGLELQTAAVDGYDPQWWLYLKKV